MSFISNVFSIQTCLTFDTQTLYASHFVCTSSQRWTTLQIYVVFSPHFYESIDSPCFPLLPGCTSSCCFIFISNCPNFFSFSLLLHFFIFPFLSLYLSIGPWPGDCCQSQASIPGGVLEQGCAPVGYWTQLMVVVVGGLDMSSLAATVCQWRDREQAKEII